MDVEETNFFDALKRVSYKVSQFVDKLTGISFSRPAITRPLKQ